MTEPLQWVVVDCYGPFRGRNEVSTRPRLHEGEIAADSAHEAAELWCESDTNTCVHTGALREPRDRVEFDLFVTPHPGHGPAQRFRVEWAPKFCVTQDAPEPDGRDYYLHDARSGCGNSAYWWGPNSKGYVLNLDKAGLYTLENARSERDTDIPIHRDEVLALAEPHVRLDRLRAAGLVDRERAFKLAQTRSASHEETSS